MAYKEDPIKVKARRKRYYATHREEALAYSKAHREANKEKVTKDIKQWRLDNPEMVKAQATAYYAKNSEHLKEYSKQWARDNPEKRKASEAKRANCPKRKAYQKEYARKRNKALYASDPTFKIVSCLRARLNSALKRAKANKVTNTLDLLGCPIDYFMKFIEKQWKEGMSWANHGKGAGKWNIDHRKPITHFNMQDEWEQRWCSHYSNLQPMWEPENLRKYNKLNYTATALAKA